MYLNEQKRIRLNGFPQYVYYYKFGNQNITIDTFLQDLHELTQYLLKHFHQKKLYLVGHSWGSVLGLTFIRQHPELFTPISAAGRLST